MPMSNHSSGIGSPSSSTPMWRYWISGQCSATKSLVAPLEPVVDDVGDPELLATRRDPQGLGPVGSGRSPPVARRGVMKSRFAMMTPCLRIGLANEGGVIDRTISHSRSSSRHGSPTLPSMPEPLSEAELREFAVVAEQSAAQVSRDPQVVREAADVAVAELVDKLDHVSTETQLRALGRDRRPQPRPPCRKKLHRDLAMGRAGSLPPPMYDEHEDERVEFLIGEMRQAAA